MGVSFPANSNAVETSAISVQISGESFCQPLEVFLQQNATIRSRLMLLASLGSAKPRLQQTFPNLSIDDMPTYDYECDACGHQFEVFQGINDEVSPSAPSAIKEAEASVWFGRLPLCSKAAGSIRRTIGVKAIKKPRLLTANQIERKIEIIHKEKIFGGKDSK